MDRIASEEKYESKKYKSKDCKGPLCSVSDSFLIPVKIEESTKGLSLGSSGLRSSRRDRSGDIGNENSKNGGDDSVDIDRVGLGESTGDAGPGNSGSDMRKVEIAVGSRMVIHSHHHLPTQKSVKIGSEWDLRNVS